MIKISVLSPSIRPEGLEIIKECLNEQTFTEFEWLVEIGLGKEHDLNKAMNKMLARAKGELIVSYQDFTKISKDGLQKFWDAYQKDKLRFYTAPLGKIKSKDFTGDVKWDWRKNNYGEIDYRRCEFDWACYPIDALKEMGGFDEELDNYWSMDNISVCKRAEMLGYTFENIDNEVIAFDHDAFSKHPFRENYRPAMSGMIIDSYENPHLNYL